MSVSVNSIPKVSVVCREFKINNMYHIYRNPMGFSYDKVLCQAPKQHKALCLTAIFILQKGMLFSVVSFLLFLGKKRLR